MKILNDRAAQVLMVLFIVILVIDVAATAQGPSIVLNSMADFFSLAPGQKYSSSVQVTNTSSEPIELSISVKDFTFTRSGSYDLLKNGSVGKHSLAPYLKFSPKQITIGPGKSKNVSYSLTLPKDVNGPHWTALVIRQTVETEPESEEEMSMQVTIGHNFAYSLVQSPPNPPDPKGKILQVNTSNNITEKSKNSLAVTANFKSLSDSIIKCTGYIELRNAQGQKISRYNIPEDRLVLPRKERIFSHVFTGDKIKPGKYLAIVVIDYGGENMVGGQKMVTVGSKGQE